MSQLAESAIPPSSPHPQITAPRPLRPPFDLDSHDLRPLPSPPEGKEATVHDFLSLCGTGINASSTSTVAAKNGSQNSVTTQDLLQPLQKNLKPVANTNVLPAGFVLSAVKSQSNGDYGSHQQLSYALVNGTLETSSNHQSKYRPANINCIDLSKTQVTQGMSVNKHNWQQGGLDMGDASKRPRIPSEEDDEDDDELISHGYSSKKDGHFHKSDPAHLFDGRNSDSKVMTPRSKHSATEQRRRSKINDRFQMLRQLLPNADQKRDKASFLLEVIEYIQMLHEKLKKYEAAERGTQQDKTGIISWDVSLFSKDKFLYTVNSLLCETHVNHGNDRLQKFPGHKDAVSNNPYVSDSNSYMKSRTTENNVTGAELISGMTQSAVLQSVSGSPPNFETKPYVSNSALLTFSQPPVISTLERTGIPAFPSRTPEGQRMFGSAIQPDEQSAAKTKGSHNMNGSLAQASSYPVDHVEDDRSRNPENTAIALNYRRSDDEREDGKSSSKCQGRHQTETMNDCKKEDDRSQHAVDENSGSWSQDRPKGDQVAANKGEPPAILGGVINISSAYSQGLLDTLTRALQSSGVDLGQATISVQIDLGKPGNLAMTNSNKTTLNTGVLSSQSKETGSSQESEQAWKRPKLEIDP